MAIINRLPVGGGVKLDNLSDKGLFGTYYQDSTGSSGAPGIFYASLVPSDYLRKDSNNQATVMKDFECLIVLSTTSSNTLSTNDYQTLEVNGTQVCATPRQSSVRNTLNVVYLKLKRGDIITGRVYHLNNSYRVYFNFEVFEIN